MQKEEISGQKFITIAYNKAIGIIAGLVLSALVSGAFIGLRTANSDHFAVAALVDAVESIPGTYVRTDVYNAQYSELLRVLQSIDKRLEKIESWEVVN